MENKEKIKEMVMMIHDMSKLDVATCVDIVMEVLQQEVWRLSMTKLSDGDGQAIAERMIRMAYAQKMRECVSGR